MGTRNRMDKRKRRLTALGEVLPASYPEPNPTGVYCKNALRTFEQADRKASEFPQGCTTEREPATERKEERERMSREEGDQDPSLLSASRRRSTDRPTDLRGVSFFCFLSIFLSLSTPLLHSVSSPRMVQVRGCSEG